MNTTVLNASIAWDPHTAEEVLTQEMNANGYNYDLYANRSVARARNSEWDKALQDAEEVRRSANHDVVDDGFIAQSITIQPSLLGYISKGIALCGNDRLGDAMEAFDLAFQFTNRDQVTIDLLLLIKVPSLLHTQFFLQCDYVQAVALFNARRHDEAMRRVQDLTTAYRHSNKYLCGNVNVSFMQTSSILSLSNALASCI
jgi:tetratricopeptide (TPR) repeat protein